MTLDFKALKAIPFTQILQKYGIAVTFAGKYAKARCPLPTHKQGDRDKNFNVNLDGNFFKCWSGSCNEKAGAKGGDTINFVALMENCSQHEAAKKLADWFHIHESKPTPQIVDKESRNINQNKSARHIVERAHQQPSKGTKSTVPVPSESVKGYMADVDAWFDEMIVQGDLESAEDYLKRVRNAVKSRLVLSFRNGKRVAAGLPLEQS